MKNCGPWEGSTVCRILPQEIELMETTSDEPIATPIPHLPVPLVKMRWRKL